MPRPVNLDRESNKPERKKNIPNFSKHPTIKVTSDLIDYSTFIHSFLYFILDQNKESERSVIAQSDSRLFIKINNCILMNSENNQITVNKTDSDQPVANESKPEEENPKTATNQVNNLEKQLSSLKINCTTNQVNGNGENHRPPNANRFDDSLYSKIIQSKLIQTRDFVD